MKTNKSLESQISTGEIPSTIPIVLAGFSGSGKDTVARAVKELTDKHHSLHNFNRSSCRYVSRAPRGDEMRGVDGHFVSEDEFSAKLSAGDFFYNYKKEAYGGTQYGFCERTLKDELSDKHTFVVGGEIETAIPLKTKLQERIQAVESILLSQTEIEANERMALILNPIMLFINRNKDAILKSLDARNADLEEIRKRKERVEQMWACSCDVIGKEPNTFAIWNDQLESSTEQILELIHSQTKTQLKAIFGNSFRLNF